MLELEMIVMAGVTRCGMCQVIHLVLPSPVHNRSLVLYCSGRGTPLNRCLGYTIPLRVASEGLGSPVTYTALYTSMAIKSGARERGSSNMTI